MALLPFLLLVGLSPFLASRQQERLARAMREQLGEVNAYTVDSIQGLKEIVAFTRGPWQLATLQAYGVQLHEVRRRFLNHLSFEHVLVEALMGAGGLVVMTLGAVLVAHGQLTATTVPVLTLLAMASFVPVSEIARIGKELADALASARRIFTVEDEPVHRARWPRRDCYPVALRIQVNQHCAMKRWALPMSPATHRPYVR